MKKFDVSISLAIITLVLQLISPNVYAFDPSQWEQMDNTSLKAMWKSKKIKDAFLNFYEEKQEFVLKDFKPADYVKELPEARGFLHRLVRIKEYKIIESSSERRVDAWQVKLKGTYLRKGKTLVTFCELHQFEKNSFKQKQLSAPADKWKDLLAGQVDCFSMMGSLN